MYRLRWLEWEEKCRNRVMQWLVARNRDWRAALRPIPGACLQIAGMGWSGWAARSWSTGLGVTGYPCWQFYQAKIKGQKTKWIAHLAPCARIFPLVAAVSAVFSGLTGTKPAAFGRARFGAYACSSTRSSWESSYWDCSYSDSSSNRCKVVLSVTYRFMRLRDRCSLRTNRFSPSISVCRDSQLGVANGEIGHPWQRQRGND